MQAHWADPLILAAIGAAIILHLYLATKLLRLNKKHALFIILQLATWAFPLIFWFWIALSGVKYEYDTSIDVSFSGALYPLYFQSLLTEILGHSAFNYFLVGSVFIFPAGCIAASILLWRSVIKPSLKQGDEDE